MAFSQKGTREPIFSSPAEHPKHGFGFVRVILTSALFSVSDQRLLDLMSASLLPHQEDYYPSVT